jgi:hypothetical protein
MTTALPPLATFSEILRTTLRTTLNAVTEGSRRNARDAISARVADDEAADLLLSALTPTSPPRASASHARSA